MELLTPKQKELMAENLLAQYKSEYALLKEKSSIDEAREQYAAKRRRGKLIPKRWRFLFWKKKNHAAEVLDREIQAEIKRYFDSREKAIARLTEALDKENEQTPSTINTEPQSPSETAKEPPKPTRTKAVTGKAATKDSGTSKP